MQKIFRELPQGFVLRGGYYLDDVDMDTIETIPSFAPSASLMQAVNFSAGEELNENPQSVSEIIGDFLADWLEFDQRQRVLLPLIHRIVLTRQTPELDHAREALFIDNVLRKIIPDVLECSDQTLASSLRNLEPLTDEASIKGAASRIEVLFKNAKLSRRVFGRGDHALHPIMSIFHPVDGGVGNALNALLRLLSRNRSSNDSAAKDAVIEAFKSVLNMVP